MKHERVLIIEPDFTGHRWRYAEWAAQAFAEAGHAVTIVTDPDNADHPLARRITAAAQADPRIAFVAPPPRARGDRIAYARAHRTFRHAFDATADRYGASFVFVPYLDYFLYALPFLGSPFGATPWSGITMRATFHQREVGMRVPSRPLVNAAKATLFRRAMQTAGLQTVLSIDPTLLDWYAPGAPRAGARLDYLADPCPDTRAGDRAEARTRLGLDARARYVLVYGAITERKGINELVAALAERPDAPTLIVAGVQDPATRTFLEAQSGRLAAPPVILDRFISDGAERDLFSACDAVWLGYKGHYGMSGVLVQAYRFERPVVATADGLIGWFCRAGEFGPVLDDLSPATIRRALGDAFEHASRRPRESAVREAVHAPLLERNTLSHFKTTLQAELN